MVPDDSLCVLPSGLLRAPEWLGDYKEAEGRWDLAYDLNEERGTGEDRAGAGWGGLCPMTTLGIAGSKAGLEMRPGPGSEGLLQDHGHPMTLSLYRP